MSNTDESTDGDGARPSEGGTQMASFVLGASLTAIIGGISLTFDGSPLGPWAFFAGLLGLGALFLGGDDRV